MVHIGHGALWTQNNIWFIFGTNIKTIRSEFIVVKNLGEIKMDSIVFFSFCGFGVGEANLMCLFLCVTSFSLDFYSHEFLYSLGDLHF